MRTFLAPLVLLLAVLSAAPAWAEQKLGVVDFQRALNEVEEGKRARATLEQRFDAAKKELENRQVSVQKMQEELEGQRMMLSAEALKEKEIALQQAMFEFQQLAVQHQQEVSTMEQEMTGNILEKLYKVAQTVGAEDGYNLVLEASSVVYLNGVTDITQKVIARFNTKQ